MNTEQRRLKRATELLVQSVGGIEKAAEIVDRSKSTVGRWTNRNDEESINVLALREIEAVADQPLVTKMLAQLAGGVFVALPQVPGSAETLPLQVMDLLKEFGELSDTVRAGYGDGDFDGKDAARALDELHDVELVTARLKMALQLLVDSDATKLRRVG